MTPERSDNKILILGVPGASTSPWEMNFATAPQGPILKERRFLEGLPAVGPAIRSVRERVTHSLRHLYNPKLKMTNVGPELIKQNLGQEMEGGEVETISYPDEEEAYRIAENTWLRVIGISIGSEPLILKGKEFARELKQRSLNPDVRIVFGNYGAVAGKKAGVLSEEDGRVLWDPPHHREGLAEGGTEPYTGEGVHDMRVFLKDIGVPVKAEPNGPITSRAVLDGDTNPKGGWPKVLYEKLGLMAPSRQSATLAVSLGCPNGCHFCNTSKMFGNQKTILFKDVGQVWEETERIAAGHEAVNTGMPGITVTIMDENFTRPMGNLVELCRRIEESGKDIRISAFGDFKGLYEYFEEHGSFLELVRGGLSGIWIGVESREDFFNKRGGATPEEIEKMIKNLQSLGVVVIGSFMVGLPYHTEGETTKDENGHFKTLNIREDFEWARNLNTAAFQVMMDSWTHLTNSAKAEPIDERLTEESFGHRRANPKNVHPHIQAERLEELDRELRKSNYLQNGPTSLRAVLTMWDGYRNFRNSGDTADRRVATFYYWMGRNYLHQFSLASAGFNAALFENHSDGFLDRLARFLHEVENEKAPSGELSRKHQEVFKRADGKISPLVKTIADRMRKRFVKKHLKSVALDEKFT